LKTWRLLFLTTSALLFVLSAPSIRSQVTASALPQAPAPAASAASVEANRKALNALFADYWQDQLEHSPEFASELGDKRYNDKITDYSVKAVNDALEREQRYLLRLAAIDPAGLTDQEKLSRDLLLNIFADDQEAASYKE